MIEVELSQKAEQRIKHIMFKLRERYGMDFNKDTQIYYFVNDVTRTTIERIGLSEFIKAQKPYFTKEELRVLNLKGGYN